MKPYADTNFLTAFYSGGIHATQAERLIQQKAIEGNGPIAVTFLTRMEVINSFQQQVFFTRNGVPGIHASPEAAMLEESLFLDDLRDEILIQLMRIEDETLATVFEELVHRHTIKRGFRAYDIMHVAAALLLGCDTFWSFDAKAKKLAELEGLKVN
jgi:predicted nucleic acid-binding protein